jgi:hypothetical protein
VSDLAVALAMPGGHRRQRFANELRKLVDGAS